MQTEPSWATKFEASRCGVVFQHNDESFKDLLAEIAEGNGLNHETDEEVGNAQNEKARRLWKLMRCRTTITDPLERYASSCALPSHAVPWAMLISPGLRLASRKQCHTSLLLTKAVNLRPAYRTQRDDCEATLRDSEVAFGIAATATSCQPWPI